MTVTRLAPLWQQNSTYPAQTDRVLIATLWPTSGSSGGAASLVAGTMNVSVAPGTAAVALGAGGVNYTALCRWDAAETVTLAAAPPSGQSRIDLVVAQVRDQVLDAGANNDFVFTNVTGTPAASNPAVPAVPVNAYPVCQVTVPGAAVNLNGATLVDRRVPLTRSGLILSSNGFASAGLSFNALGTYDIVTLAMGVVPVAARLVVNAVTWFGYGSVAINAGGDLWSLQAGAVGQGSGAPVQAIAGAYMSLPFNYSAALTAGQTADTKLRISITGMSGGSCYVQSYATAMLIAT
jgi:hypothetical protein